MGGSELTKEKSLCRYIAEEMTSSQDQYSLCQCLAAILQKLFEPDSFALYELKARDGGIASLSRDQGSIRLLNMLDSAQLPITLTELDGAQEAVNKNRSVEVELPENKKRLIHPVQGLLGVHVLIVLDEYSFEGDAPGLIANLATIFGNLNLLLMQSERDALTGLLNRQAFERVMGQVHLDLANIYRRKKDRDHFSFFALLDIDHFKNINDTYGHLHGDEVLLSFARLMDSTFRHTDHLFRYGGEEFAVILTNIAPEICESVLERFRERVQANLFPQVGEVTVSIGVSEISAEQPISSIIEQADRALYFAKNSGRNRVASYEELVASGRMEPIMMPVAEVDLF